MTADSDFVLHESGLGFVERPPISYMLADLFEAAYRERLAYHAEVPFTTVSPALYEALVANTTRRKYE